MKIFALLIAVAGLAGLGWFAYTRITASSGSEAIYAPPTKEEKNAGTVQKEKLVEEKARTTSPASGSKTAQVSIIDAGQYENSDGTSIIEVRSIITNIIEQGGRCDILFTNGSTTINKSVAARPDATTTQCETLTVPRNEFATAGQWMTTVRYVSAGITGEAKTNITIK